MTGKPEGGQESMPLGPKTTFTWVAVVAMFTIASMATSAFYSIKGDVASINSRMGAINSTKLSRWELTRWTKELQRDNIGGIKVPVYAPEEKTDGEER
jgi:hypothetical protein